MHTTHRHAAIAGVAALLGLTITGCGANQASDNNGAALPLPSATAASAAPSATPSASAAKSTSPTSPRGNRIKALGENAGLCADMQCSSDVLTFAVDSIAVDAQCTERFAQPPTNGHLIVVALRVSTSPELKPQDAAGLFNPYAFSVVGPDGVTETGLVTSSTYGCLAEGQRMPDSLAPGSQYRGTIVLDSKSASGVVQLRAGGQTGGWEWKFGA